MAKLTKKKASIREVITVNKLYAVKEAVEILKRFASKKFNEGVDVSINLGIDAKKTEQDEQRIGRISTAELQSFTQR